MPIDFPSSPTNGQVSGNYYYDATTGAWRSFSSTVNTIPSTLKNLTVSSSETTGVSLKVTPFTTSSVNLQEWYNTSSNVVASINVAGDLTANELNLTGSEINGDSKTIVRYSDAWLRLNPDLDFSSGIYTNTSLIRTDNGLQVGANGTNFLATSSALTHNGTDILKKDLRQYYTVGAVGTGTAANYYEIFTWTIVGQYNNFSAQLQINGRGNTDPRYVVHVRGEYGVSAWANEVLTISSDHALPDGDTWLLVFSDLNKTAKLYYRRTGNDWNDRSLNFNAHWTGSATPVYSNTNFGTAAPTGDAVITKTAPDAIAVVSGGTGATTFTSGAYLKGAGTSAITAQTGIPAGDVTSGTLDIARMPAGTVLQVKTVRYSGRPAIGFSTSDVILSDLSVSITPKRSNSLLIAQYQICGEMTYNTVFRAYRDGGLISTSGYQGYNENDGNTWSGIAVWPYDTDIASTPNTQFIQYFVPSGNTNATTLQISIRSSANESQTFYMNRSTNSTGAIAYEIMVSNVIVWEIAQ